MQFVWTRGDFCAPWAASFPALCYFLSSFPTPISHFLTLPLQVWAWQPKSRGASLWRNLSSKKWGSFPFFISYFLFVLFSFPLLLRPSSYSPSFPPCLLEVDLRCLPPSLIFIWGDRVPLHSWAHCFSGWLISSTIFLLVLSCTRVADMFYVSVQDLGSGRQTHTGHSYPLSHLTSQIFFIQISFWPLTITNLTLLNNSISSSLYFT